MNNHQLFISKFQSLMKEFDVKITAFYTYPHLDVHCHFEFSDGIDARFPVGEDGELISRGDDLQLRKTNDEY